MSKNVTNETFQKHLGLLNKKLQLNEDISEVTTDGSSLPELALKGAEVIDVITSSDGKVHLRIKAANSTQLYDAVLV